MKIPDRVYFFLESRGRMSSLFVFKLTLVPFFILALSLAGRRWGTAFSGWLVALPVVAGPIVFFIGMEQGEAFAAGAARATIAGLASLAVYSLVYCRAALSDGMGAESAGRLGRVFPLHVPPEPAPPHAAAVDRARLFRAGRGVPSPAGGRYRSVAARDAFVGDRRAHGGGGRDGAPHDRPCPPFGPHLAGLLVPFPVAATVLTVFTHHYRGGASAVRLLRGLVAGLWTMGIFFLVVAGTVERLGVGASFALARRRTC